MRFQEAQRPTTFSNWAQIGKQDFDGIFFQMNFCYKNDVQNTAVKNAILYYFYFVVYQIHFHKRRVVWEFNGTVGGRLAPATRQEGGVDVEPHSAVPDLQRGAAGCGAQDAEGRRGTDVGALGIAENCELEYSKTAWNFVKKLTTKTNHKNDTKCPFLEPDTLILQEGTSNLPGTFIFEDKYHSLFLTQSLYICIRTKFDVTPQDWEKLAVFIDFKCKMKWDFTFIRYKAQNIA